MLKNKEGLWMSDEEWNFKTKDDLIYIENIGEFVKKTRKNATRVCKLNYFSDNTQKWKLGKNKKLENKEGVWKSDDLWIFKNKSFASINL